MKSLILIILVASLVVESSSNCSYQPIQYDFLEKEGVCPCAYYDSEGNKTIGIGKLIKNSIYLEEVKLILDLTDNQLKDLSNGKLVLNPFQIRELLDYSVSEAEETAKNYITQFDQKTDTIRHVLIDLQFNGNLLYQFIKFRDQINKNNIEKAIQELIYSDPNAEIKTKSPYCSSPSTIKRCEQNVNLLTNCINEHPVKVQNRLQICQDTNKCLLLHELTMFCKLVDGKEIIPCLHGFQQLQGSDAKSYDDYCKQNYQINLQISQCFPDSFNSLNTAYKIPQLDDWVWILQAMIKPKDSNDYKCYQLYKQFFDDANMIAYTDNKVSGNVSYAINYINRKKVKLNQYCVNSDLYKRVLNHYREIKHISLNELDIRIINQSKKNCKYLKECNFDFSKYLAGQQSCSKDQPTNDKDTTKSNNGNSNSNDNNGSKDKNTNTGKDQFNDTDVKSYEQLTIQYFKLLVILYFIF
ncbi:hypothetical protein ABPG74_000110 [Tetrahymena malaccensis]